MLGYYDDSKSITKDIKELRMAFGSGYRIYFTEQDSVIIILLCGGNKSTQKKDSENAKKYLTDLRGH